MMFRLAPILLIAGLMSVCTTTNGQGGPRPTDLGASNLDVGEPGIAWYTTWETAQAEAKRSGRAIMFVAAATQCHGISGVFWPGYTATQNGLFASDEFIKVSREFVCVRIDSYESETHQKYVRTFLDGRFENSVFCLLEPNGEDWLSRANRGPEMVLGRRLATERMAEVSALYPPTADVRQAIVPDFHSVRQAMNVASADQRVLVLVYGAAQQTEPLRESLRAVSSDERIIGRFHFDFDADDVWKKSVTGLKGDAGIAIIKSGEFGMHGSVMKQLPLDADNSAIVAALLAANEEFARTTEKKVYSDHVAKGHSEGVYFEGAVPYGEDRDGDGLVDKLLRGGGRGGPPRGPRR